jgi:hypothetical protein
MTTPRSVHVDRMLFDVNGSAVNSPDRFGNLTRERAGEVLDLFKAAASNPLSETGDALEKAVTQATGLVAYDLRAPALNLFPTITPLRNAFPRKQRAQPGTALNYKTILSLAGSGYNFMGWVPEGQRAGQLTYTSNSVAVPYATIGEEDSITDEAREAAKGFEDEDAMVQLRTLLKLMTKEEAGLLAGNASLALGVPTAPTLSATGSGATLPALTYSVIVVALTMTGYLQSALATGVPTTLTVTGRDSKTFSLNGGASNKSAAATVVVSLGQILGATVPVVNGAVGYAWYVGASGAETLQAITTINSATFSAPLAGGRQAATVFAADYSRNPGLAYDGFMTAGYTANVAGNSYLLALPTGAAGAGTQLSASGYGSVNEIDVMLKAMWDNFRVSPTVIYVNSQEQRSITKLSLTGAGAAPLMRYNNDVNGTDLGGMTAGNVVTFYKNPYSTDGATMIPVKIHPNLAPGTIMTICERLPAWYVQNETPQVAEVITRKDYYTEQWVRQSRVQDYGIYCQSALAVYAPFAVGLLTNIAPTP